MKRCFSFTAFLLLIAYSTLQAQTDGPPVPKNPPSQEKKTSKSKDEVLDWQSVLLQSGFMLGVQHGYRNARWHEGPVFRWMVSKFNESSWMV
jgi:hypothetical protein